MLLWNLFPFSQNLYIVIAPLYLFKSNRLLHYEDEIPRNIFVCLMNILGRQEGVMHDLEPSPSHSSFRADKLRK